MMVPFHTAPTLTARHGFFTRRGGVSTGFYDSLNASFSSDAPELVRENRRRIVEALGGGALLGLKQVHGPVVITVTEPWAEGDGPAADALVTALPGLALGVITADCAPVLFAGDNGVVGAAHAGWKGAVAGVLEATVAAMRALGAVSITAAIGPCIHQPSYEVGQDLHDAVLAASPGAQILFAPGRPEHWYFDLPAYCKARLRRAGVATEVLAHDTCTDEANFFSYRRRTRRNEPVTGHQLSVICS